MNASLYLDVDGTLSGGRFCDFDLAQMATLRSLLAEKNVNVILSSGRSQPYMEAVAQVIGTNLPYICENGANIFDPAVGGYVFEVTCPELDDFRQVLLAADLGSVHFEPGKTHSLSFAASRSGAAVPVETTFAQMHDQLDLPDSLRSTHSGSAIDIVPADVSKETAARVMAERLQQDLQQSRAMGDSSNDIELLRGVGHSGAPANAIDSVRQMVSYVSPHEDVAGVIDYVTRFY